MPLHETLYIPLSACGLGVARIVPRRKPAPPCRAGDKSGQRAEAGSRFIRRSCPIPRRR